jgi:GTP cyclohydrolase I
MTRTDELRRPSDLTAVPSRPPGADLSPAQRRALLTQIGRDLLIAIGEDPQRDGLRGTPERFARWWLEFLSGGEPEDDGAAHYATFEIPGANEMVAVSGLRVWSLCEHHLLPFNLDLTMAYIPRDGRVLGLSKFMRLARRQARHLQVQERLIQQIGLALQHATGSNDFAVIGSGEHLCLSMRGARAPGHRMHGSMLHGAFKNAPAARQELFSLAGLPRHGG